MTPRQLLAAIGLSALLTAPALHAQALRDPAWNTLLEQDRHAELEAAARQRLKAEPADPQATAALGYALLAHAQPADVDAALPLVEACLQRHPQAGECHHMLGLVMGVQALRAGMLKAMTMAGRIRTGFEQGVALAPDNFNHRVGLLQYYLAAPAIAGGGVDKARELVRQTEARDAEQGRCLQAMVALSQERFDEAERLLWPLLAAAQPAVRNAAYQQLGGMGAARLQNQQVEPARTLFERLAQADPGRALAVYGLARVKQEAGALQDALRLYAQARGLRGQAGLPLDYREALAWLGLGDTAKARALLQRFVSAGRGHPKHLEDARERLARLG
ncbi:hypothetical protein [Ideonella sp.]|uniref:hypothetical protein n=1 Tax=Ideonella sp. TaxID=1929293 RepID=UPI0035B18E69